MAGDATNAADSANHGSGAELALIATLPPPSNPGKERAVKEGGARITVPGIPFHLLT